MHALFEKKWRSYESMNANTATFLLQPLPKRVDHSIRIFDHWNCLKNNPDYFLWEKLETMPDNIASQIPIRDPNDMHKYLLFKSIQFKKNNTAIFLIRQLFLNRRIPLNIPVYFSDERILDSSDRQLMGHSVLFIADLYQNEHIKEYLQSKGARINDFERLDQKKQNGLELDDKQHGGYSIPKSF
jgi:hypothetical protein